MAESKKPKRPYLLRALYDWVVDSELTPYVLVDAEVEGVVVPGEFVQDGRIVLNVAPHAVRDLALDEKALICNCRFGGKPFEVYLPMASIQAIYARETGEGMVFEPEEFPGPPESGPEEPPPKPSGGGHLKVVK
ncbi:MAG: ClpXP protease specificity-enhancing factor [Pseudomonadota bacterium]